MAELVNLSAERDVICPYSNPDPDPDPDPNQLLLKEHLLESPRWLAGRISNPKPNPKPKPNPNLTLTLTRLAGRSHEEAFLAQQVLAPY